MHSPSNPNWSDTRRLNLEKDHFSEAQLRNTARQPRLRGRHHPGQECVFMVGPLPDAVRASGCLPHHLRGVGGGV